MSRHPSCTRLPFSLIRDQGSKGRAAASVFAAFRESGMEARIVGGYVRDALSGAPPGDIDMAVNALPDRFVPALERAAITVKPIGIRHGVVLALAAGGVPIEIAALRRDVATDGRRAIVAFGSDWLTDAKRRDFTVNALYADEEGRIHDPLGCGIADVRARRLRFIGAPEKRLAEDHLRLLRYFRFLPLFDRLAPSQATIRACREWAPRLALISGERIASEMQKILAVDDPLPVARLMEQTGVWRVIAPDGEAGSLERLIEVERHFALPPNWRRRLAFMHGESDWLAPLAARWRLSRADSAALRKLGEAKVLAGAPSAFGYRFGAAIGLEGFAMALAARGAQSLPDICATCEAIERGAAARFPIGAADLMARGVPEGQRIGSLLLALEARWIDSDFTLGKAALLARIP